MKKSLQKVWNYKNSLYLCYCSDTKTAQGRYISDTKSGSNERCTIYKAHDVTSASKAFIYTNVIVLLFSGCLGCTANSTIMGKTSAIYTADRILLANRNESLFAYLRGTGKIRYRKPKLKFFES